MTIYYDFDIIIIFAFLTIDRKIIAILVFEIKLKLALKFN